MPKFLTDLEIDQGCGLILTGIENLVSDPDMFVVVNPTTKQLGYRTGTQLLSDLDLAVGLKLLPTGTIGQTLFYNGTAWTSNSRVYFDATNYILRLSGANGATELSRFMHGIELVAGGMNTSSKYGAGIKFMSSDPELITENPKFLAAIIPRARQTYGSDVTGGMALDFFTTPINPGAASIPVLRMSLDSEGPITIYGSLTVESSAVITANSSTGYFLNSSSSGISVMSGGSSSTDGGSIVYYGGSNATYPGKIHFRSGSTIFAELLANGRFKLNNIPDAGSDVDKFIVSNSGEISYRTGDEVISDLGGLGGLNYWSKTGSNLYYSGGNVIVGGSYSYDKLTVHATPVKTNYEFGISVLDNTAMAAGVGGGIGFIGKYTTAGDVAALGGIDMAKANATSGDYQFDLRLWSRANGSIPSVKAILTGIGYFGIGMYPLTTLDVAGTGRFSSTLTIGSISDSGGDTDKFLVSNNGVVSYRTGTELLDDIGGLPGLNYWTKSGNDIYYSAGNVGLGTGTSSLDALVEIGDGALKLNTGSVSGGQTNARRLINVAARDFVTTTTGTMVVTLPYSTGNRMGKITISGQGYSSQWKVVVSAYMRITGYSWYVPAHAEIYGNPPFTAGEVRLCADSGTGNFFIFLGSTVTVWPSYTAVFVDVETRYNNYITSSGWDLTIVSTEPIVTSTTTRPASLFGTTTDIYSNLTVGGQIISGKADGMAPFVITSRTLNFNLNADLLDGQEGSYYATSSHNHSGVYEPVLGNPTTSGYLLSSTSAGVRSWVAPYSYTHPAKTWVDKTALTGAYVISNLTVDSLGHPTDWTTRQLTYSDVGAAASGHAHTGVYDYYNHWMLGHHLPNGTGGTDWINSGGAFGITVAYPFSMVYSGSGSTVDPYTITLGLANSAANAVTRISAYGGATWTSDTEIPTSKAVNSLVSGFAPLNAIAYHTEAISLVNATAGNSMLYMVPHASQAGNIIHVRNKGNTADLFTMDPNGLLTMKNQLFLNYSITADGLIVGSGRSTDALICGNLASGTGSLFALDYAGTNKVSIYNDGMAWFGGSVYAGALHSFGSSWSGSYRLATEADIYAGLFPAGATIVRCKKVTLTYAQLLQLNTTPVLLISGVAGTIVNILSVVGILDYHDSAVFGGSATLQVYTSGGSGIICYSNATFYTAPEDTAQPFVMSAPSGTDKIYKDGAAIYITASANLTSGSSNNWVNIYITYTLTTL